MTVRENPGAENPGTDGTVHAAKGHSGLRRAAVHALGQFPQSPGFLVLPADRP